MLERLVGRDIIRTPREVCRCRRLHTCTRRACNGCYVHLVIQQLRLRKWQQRQLNSRSEATRVCDACCTRNLLALHLRQTIDKAIVLITKILCQVHNLHVGRNVVLLHKLSTCSVSRAEEQQINCSQVVLRREAQVTLSIQSAVYLAHEVASITRRVDKGDFHLRVVNQQTNQLTRGVACATYDTNLNHYFPFFFWLL